MGKQSSNKKSSSRDAVAGVACLVVFVGIVGYVISDMRYESSESVSRPAATPAPEPLPPAPDEPARRKAAARVPLATFDAPRSAPGSAAPPAAPQQAGTDKVPSTTINGESSPASPPKRGLVSTMAYPSQVASAAKADPALVQWLTRWEQSALAGRTPANSDGELQASLQKTTLSPSSLCEIGHAVMFIAKGPGKEGRRAGDQAAQPWYRQAMIRADAIASKIERGSPEALALATTITACENTFWQLRDGESIESYTSALTKLLPADHPRLATVRTSHAGALYLQGKNGPAANVIGELGSEPGIPLTAEEQTEIRWVRGLVLHQAGRYEDAIPFLEATAVEPGYHHAKDAWPILVLSLAKAGKAQEADVMLDRWIREGKPSVEQVASILRAMGAQRAQ